MSPLTGGQWITVHGHHIYIKGAKLSSEHASDIADKAGLSDEAKKAVLDAHAKGTLSTDAQLHAVTNDIAGAVAVGFDEAHATHKAIQAHSGTASHGGSSIAAGNQATTPVWLPGKGKSKGTHVSVQTHGAPLLPGETDAYAAKFGIDKEGAAVLSQAAANGTLKHDTHLAQTVADAIHVAKMTGAHHSDVIHDLLNGSSATDLIAQLKAAQAAMPTPAPAPSVPAPSAPPAPATSAPSPAAPATSPAHHVTIQAQKFPVDHSQPATIGDVDALKAKIKVSTNGESTLKNAILGGTIKTHGELMEKAAMTQAASLASGHTSVNNFGFYGTSSYPGIESLLDAAHHGDASAKNIVAKLEDHSFQSPAAKAAAQSAAQKAQSDVAFQSATPQEHTHKQIGGKGGYNDGGLYELPDGTKNYVKTPTSAAVAHNEHLANEIYKALGISAPNSKVFTDGSSKTQYASQFIENDGDLAKRGITPEVSREILKGFAADMLLGNHDVLGNGDKPLSNVVVGKDGKPHRIDNGGSLLFTGTGNAKSTTAKNELREWDGFASASTNANYAKVFQQAGVKDAASVPGIGQQIKAISALRDAHGGWDGFIQHAAPDMPEAQRKETAQLLEARTQLLEAKAKTVAGANSLVGVRTFHYDDNGGKGHSHGDTHEQTLIDHQNAHAPKLTAQEKKAVESFKGGAYHSWNSNLRGEDALTSAQLEKTKTLDALFQKPGMVLGVDSALSRKVTLSDDEKKRLASLAPGTVIAHTPNFQSTSTDSGVWHGNTHFCILAPKETPAVMPKAHSAINAGENEALLPRGLSYRVVSVAGPNDAAPDHTPAGWKWASGATKIVLEAIVPGVNDVEHDGVATHIVEADKLQAKAPMLAQNHASAPLPNLSGLPASTIPHWNGGTALPAAAPPVSKGKGKSKKIPITPPATTGWASAF